MSKNVPTSSPHDYIPITEDVESTRRTPPGMDRETALHLPQLTVEWHRHWHHYRRRLETEARSRSSLTTASTTEEGVSLKTEVREGEPVRGESDDLHHDEESRREEEEEEEVMIRYQRLFLALLGISPSLSSGRKRERGTGTLTSPLRDTISTTMNTNTHHRSTTTNNNNNNNTDGKRSASVMERVYRPAPSASLQREWCQSALSLAMLRHHHFPRLHAFDATQKRQPAPGNDGGTLASKLLVERVQAYFHWRSFPELLPFVSISHSSPNTATRPQGLVAPLWEDRRHRIDDLTLQSAPAPMPCSSATTTTTTEGDKNNKSNEPTQGMKRGLGGAGAPSARRPAALYPEDIRRMDPVAFRGRVEMLWDLAQAMVVVGGAGAPAAVRHGEGEGNGGEGREGESRWVASHSPSHLATTYMYGAPSKDISSSRDGIAVLLPLLSVDDAEEKTRGEGESGAPRPFPHPSARDIAGLIRARVLLELCVLRLHAHTPRCPFLWRTLAQLFMSLDTSPTVSGEVPRNSIDLEGSASSSPPPLPTLFAQYIHRVILPYLHLKDRYIESIRCATSDARKPEEEDGMDADVNEDDGLRGGATSASAGSLSSHRYAYAHQRVRALMRQYPNGLRRLLPPDTTVKKSEEEEEEGKSERNSGFLYASLPPEADGVSPLTHITSSSSAAQLADHLMAAWCGWCGDLDEEEMASHDLEASHLATRLLASRRLLRRGIPSGEAGKAAPACPAQEAEGPNPVALFLLRDTIPVPGVSGKTKTSPHRSTPNGNRNSTCSAPVVLDPNASMLTTTTTTTTAAPAPSAPAPATESISPQMMGLLFHSSASRRVAWEAFISQYFLSDPRAAFDSAV